MIYFSTFNAIAVTAAQDIFEIVAPSNAWVLIREVRFGQYSDAGDAEAEILSILGIRGNTTSGSAGASVTPTPQESQSLAATATVERNNTTVASAGSPLTMIADTANVASGWWFRPPADERILLRPSERFVFRITAPADEITCNGTLVHEERAQPPA